MSRSLMILALVTAVAIVGLLCSDASVNGAYNKYTFSPKNIRDTGSYSSRPQQFANVLWAPKTPVKKLDVKKNQTSTRAIPAVPAQRVNGTTTSASPAIPAVPPAPSAATCTDSDGGKTYTQRGTVTVGGKEYKDSCRNNYLTEFACKDGKKQSLGVLCMECIEGACTRVA